MRTFALLAAVSLILWCPLQVFAEDLNKPDKEGLTPLQKAVIQGDLARVESLLQRGANVNFFPANGSVHASPLRLAFQSGYTDIAIRLIGKGANVNESVMGRPLLYWVVAKRKWTIAEEMIRHGADGRSLRVDGGETLSEYAARTNPGFLVTMVKHDQDVSQIIDLVLGRRGGPWSYSESLKQCRDEIVLCALRSGRQDLRAYKKDLIEWAGKNDSPEAMSILIAHPLIQEEKGAGLSRLMDLAIAQNRTNAIDMLLKAGFEINQPLHGETKTVLLKALEKGSGVLVRFLMDKGAELKESGGEKTYLQHAIEKKMYDLVVAFIGKGANVNEIMKNGKTYLQVAIEANDGQLFGILMKAHADVSLTNSTGQVPLQMAMLRENTNMVMALHKAGAKVSFAKVGYSSVIDWAVRHKMDAILQECIQRGIGYEKNDTSLLQWAVKNDKVGLARMLLENGFGLDWIGPGGNPPLHCAISAEMARLLLDKKADIAEANRDGLSVVHHAIKESYDTNLIKLYIDRDTRVLGNQEFGKETLQHAVNSELATVVEYLVTRGVSWNGVIKYYGSVPGWSRVDNNGTLLHWAVEMDALGLAKALLAKGASVHAVDRLNGSTPLHRVRSAAMARLLIPHGANVNVVNQSGEKPLKLVTNLNISSEMKDELIAVLRKHGAVF